jgi:hypothetical protein
MLLTLIGVFPNFPTNEETNIQERSFIMTLITAYKCTRSNGTDFQTGTVDYSAALKSGRPLIHPDPEPANGSVCGRGFHVSPTAKQAIIVGARIVLTLVL